MGSFACFVLLAQSELSVLSIGVRQNIILCTGLSKKPSYGWTGGFLPDGLLQLRYFWCLLDMKHIQIWRNTTAFKSIWVFGL